MPNEKPRPDGSLGPLYLAGALEEVGIETDILDASVGTPSDSLDTTFNRHIMQLNGLVRIGMTYERICEVIARGGYNVVGIHSNFTPQTRMALEVAKAAKNVSKDILVVAGGVNARALPEKFLTSGVDVICSTEGERIIVRIIRALEEERRFSDVSGTITSKDGEIVHHYPEPGDTLIDLDGLPFPAWQKLPFTHYDRVASAGRSFLKDEGRSAPIMTSRGCPFSCNFCHISEEKEFPEKNGRIGNLRFNSEERVIEELRKLKTLGVRKVYFEDDSLLAKKARVRKIFTRVRGMGLQIADVNGVNLIHFLKKENGRHAIDEEYLELLASVGFNHIVFPVESASQRILDKYATGKLNHSTLDVVELVRVARRLEISCPINIMIGFPDETEEEMVASIELGRRLVDAGADYCSLKIPIPFPGSQLFNIALQEGHLQSNVDTDIFNWSVPVMENTVVPPERIMELQRRGSIDINTDEFNKARLELEIGNRWQSGEI